MITSETYEAFFADTVVPSNDNYILHSHNNYEILLFLEGDITYVVEGKSYKLAPGDMTLIRKHQLHRPYHNSPVEYKRIVINISPHFFALHHCPEYEELFINESLKLDNIIPAAMVKTSGLYDALMRMQTYTDNFEKEESPIYVSCLMEILYLLSGIQTFSKAVIEQTQFSNVVDYVNEHFQEKISLDYLSEMFFISRFYLCRLFKQKTGMTIHQYINKKRFFQVEDATKNGVSITDAAVEAGFDSYSVFYRAYIQEFGVKPRDGLK